MNLCNQKFAGPLSLDAPGIRAGAPGVYVIVCDCTDGKKRMVDVAHAAAIEADIRDPGKRQEWVRAYNGNLSMYVWYSPQPDDLSTRESLTRSIVERYRPWCRR